MTDIRREEIRETTPGRLAETTPPSYYINDHSFTLQAIMEMQKNLGQLTQAVTTLTEVSKNNTDKLDKISHKIYAAQVIIGIIGGTAAVLLTKFWDVIVSFLQANPHK